MTTFLGLLVLAVLMACPVGWIYIGSRWRNGIEPVEYEPRRVVPWDGPATLLVIGLYLGGQVATPFAAKHLYEDYTGHAFNVDAAGNDPQFLIRALAAHVVFSAILYVVGLGMLMTWNRATLADVGLSLRRFPYDVKLGIASFFLIIPPVLLMQAALSKLFSPSTHPLIEGLQQDHSPQLVLWSVLAAVVTAPLVEEFFFRGVLQGWFERMYGARARAELLVDETSNPTVVPPSSDAVAGQSIETSSIAEEELPVARSSFGPIIVSSVIFALAHFGNGPDPVPIFFLALGLGYLYRQTHRLWPGIILHFMLNSFSTLYVIFGLKPE